MQIDANHNHKKGAGRLFQFQCQEKFDRCLLWFYTFVVFRSTSNKFCDRDYHDDRKRKLDEYTRKRSLERSRKRRGIEERDNDESSSSFEGRTRSIVSNEYGPRLFQIDDIVTIMKDTSPGVHFRTRVPKVYSWRSVFHDCHYIMNLK